jgi:hypothetical protein
MLKADGTLMNTVFSSYMDNYLFWPMTILLAFVIIGTLAGLFATMTERTLKLTMIFAFIIVGSGFFLYLLATSQQ